MSMTDYIFHIEHLIDFDKQKLFEESFDLNYDEFKRPDPKPGSFFNHIPEWKRTIASTSEGSRVRQQIEDLLSFEFEQHFYVIEPNFTLPMHKDRGVKSALNIVVSDDDACIEFEDVGKCNYTCAFVNVAEKRHSVTTNKERRLFRLISWKISHDEVVRKLNAL